MNFDTICCAIDFTPESERVFREAVSLAEHHAARVRAVHVTHVQPRATTLDPLHGVAMNHLAPVPEELAEERMTRFLERHDTGGVEVESDVRLGETASTLLEAAASCDADLLVVGTHGRTGLDRLLMGNTAERLVRAASIPVLCVPTPEGQ